MSRKRLHVGNLSKFTSERELEEAFAEYGAVLSVTLVRDQRTDKPIGFGFVEYETIEGARDGLLALNGSMLHGHLLSVDLAGEPSAQSTSEGAP